MHEAKYQRRSNWHRPTAGRSATISFLQSIDREFSKFNGKSETAPKNDLNRGSNGSTSTTATDCAESPQLARPSRRTN
jgi:hypothetical protein